MAMEFNTYEYGRLSENSALLSMYVCHRETREFQLARGTEKEISEKGERKTRRAYQGYTQP